MTNPRHTVLYIGVTNDLCRRVLEHKQKEKERFTKKYNTRLLVYYEQFSDMVEAIEREKELKGWLRVKKESLITLQNPDWKDLYYEIC